MAQLIMALSPLTALSPLDGRYHSKVAGLSEYFSEFGLIRYRVKVEIEWLKAISAATQLTDIAALSTDSVKHLDDLARDFSIEDAESIKAIESRTNHDVKAIEYWLRERLAADPEAAAITRFIHFACTSEDINNLCHAFMLRDSRQQLVLPSIDKLTEKLRTLAHVYADLPMLSRTHGQSATPSRRLSRLRLGNPVAAARRKSRFRTQRLYDPDRTARWNRHAAGRLRRSEHGLDRPDTRHLVLYLSRLFQAKSQGK